MLLVLEIVFPAQYAVKSAFRIAVDGKRYLPTFEVYQLKCGVLSLILTCFPMFSGTFLATNVTVVCAKKEVEKSSVNRRMMNRIGQYLVNV